MSTAARFLHWRKWRDRIIAGDPPSRIAKQQGYKYVSQMIIATPPWVENADIRAIDRHAQWCTRIYGEKHSIDHIVPLRHPRVCGLNVPINMRVITLAENTRKGNAWCQWHGELFDEPEQFKLALHP